MSGERRTTPDEARRVGDQIGVDWDRFDLEQFRAGMDVEYEHGSHDPQTDVTGDDPVTTGKIALAHMKEFPDYYDRLQRMEQEAEQASAAARHRSGSRLEPRYCGCASRDRATFRRTRSIAAARAPFNEQAHPRLRGDDP